MIESEKRMVIYHLHKEGMSTRRIARQLGVCRKTVRKIIKREGKAPAELRSDKKEVDVDLLRKIYKDCEGYVQRVFEILTEEHEIKIGYSTLARLVQEHDLGNKNSRCDQKEDIPGEEMQHDTSPYCLKIGSKRIHVICSGIYFRYSKIRYVWFYRSFNRFRMKCFLFDALSFWKHVASKCIIDNTNLAILRGTGKNALIVPEMKDFAKHFGFEFIAHEIKHSNRKAGKERNFRTINTNFFPGRTFSSMADLNKQVLDWATNRYAKRPLSKTRLIPVELLEYEKPYLNKLPSYMHPPYLFHERRIDQYGYVSLNGNYFWIPGTKREWVKVFEYPHKIKVYKNRECLIEYALPESDVKRKKYKPEGVNTSPYKPRKRNSSEEEKRLREMDDIISEYIDEVLKQVRQRHRYIRRLYSLSKKLSKELFIKTIDRAHTYHVMNIDSLERISLQLMQTNLYELPEVEIDDDYQLREAYQEGRFCQEHELNLKDYNDDNK